MCSNVYIVYIVYIYTCLYNRGDVGQKPSEDWCIIGLCRSQSCSGATVLRGWKICYWKAFKVICESSSKRMAFHRARLRWLYKSNQLLSSNIFFQKKLMTETVQSQVAWFDHRFVFDCGIQRSTYSNKRKSYIPQAIVSIDSLLLLDVKTRWPQSPLDSEIWTFPPACCSTERRQVLQMVWCGGTPRSPPAVGSSHSPPCL